jgi:ketosteroid isomerase-like protein
VSAENIEFVRRGLDAFNRHDLDGLRSMAAPDLVVVSLRDALEGGAYRGADAFDRAFADFDESWEELRCEADEYRAADDRVLVTGRLIARGRASGAAVELPVAWIFRLRSGQLVHVRVYLDVAEALGDLGAAG